VERHAVHPHRSARPDGRGVFPQETREFLASLRKSPIAPGFDKVRVAGDPERETKAKREKEGIPVDATTWDEINVAGAKVGVAKTTIDRLAAG